MSTSTIVTGSAVADAQESPDEIVASGDTADGTDGSTAPSTGKSKSKTATVISVARTGWGAFSSAKNGIAAVTSPVRFMKDALLGLLRTTIMAALKLTIGPKLANSAIDRLNLVGKTLPFTIPVTLPQALAQRVDQDVLALAQDAANEVLAGPLEMLGYRLARMAVHFDEATRVLTIDFEAGLMSVNDSPLAAPAAALPQLSTSAAEPQELREPQKVIEAH